MRSISSKGWGFSGGVEDFQPLKKVGDFRLQMLVFGAGL
jgi:hypothetical protein